MRFRAWFFIFLLGIIGAVMEKEWMYFYCIAIILLVIGEEIVTAIKNK